MYQLAVNTAINIRTSIIVLRKTILSALHCIQALVYIVPT